MMGQTLAITGKYIIDAIVIDVKNECKKVIIN